MEKDIIEKKLSKKKRKQIRYAEFVSQIEAIAKAYNCTSDEAITKVLERINDNRMFKYYVGILHDKDIDDYTGEIKQAHVHIMLALKYPQTAQSIASALGMGEQTIEFIKAKKPFGKKWVSDFGGALSYLTHKNAPEKHQYDDSEVFCSDGFNWIQERNKSEKIQSGSDLERILEGIKDGTIKRCDIANEIDMNFYLQNKKVIEDAFTYRSLMIENNHDRNIVCIYIHGQKGTGKTTLAKEFCKNKQLTYFITGGSNDPLEGYGGEEVLIIDDARPSSFEPEEWLKLLDNNTKTKGKSRYHNKDLDVDYIILTSTIPLQEFFDIYPKEDIKQLYRRIKLYICVEKEEIFYMDYKNELEHYELIQRAPNHILEKFNNPNLTESQKNYLLDGFSHLNDEESENIEMSLESKKIALEVKENE